MENDDIGQIEQAESYFTQPKRIKLVPIKQLMNNSQTQDAVVQHDFRAEVHQYHTSDMGEINVNAINQNKCNEISHSPSTSRESVKSSQYLTRAALKSRKHRENIKAHPNPYRKDHSTERTRAFRARQLFEKLQNEEILPSDPLELSTEEDIHQESHQDTVVQHYVYVEVHQCHTSDIGEIDVNAINQNHDRLQSSIDLQATPSISKSGKNAQKTKRYRAKFKNETERKKRISERRKKYRESYKSKKSEQLHDSNEISHLPSTSRESVNSSQCLTKAALKSRKYRDNIRAHPNLYRKDYSTERVRAYRARKRFMKLQNAEILPSDPLELSTGEVIQQEFQQGLQSSIDLQATSLLSKSGKKAKKKKDYSTERVRAFRTRQFLKKLENAEILPPHPSESDSGEVTHQESQQE